MSFDIHVHGLDEDALSDREKEETAVLIHQLLQEEHDVHPDSVGVEGYSGGDA
jgi:hypothetical protein